MSGECMFELKKLLSALVLPPIGPLLLGGLGLLLAGRHPRSGRALAGLATVALVLMSIPMVSDTALHSLEVYPPIDTAALKQADVIVILGGSIYGSAPEYGDDTVAADSLVRCRYGAVLARATGLPVAVSGGAVFGGRPVALTMADMLKQEFGVPVRFVESASRDTRENAILTARLLKAAGVSRIALVSHAYHLRRAVPLFQAQGLTVIPAPTAFTGGPDDLWVKLVPSVDAMRNMALFAHEWVGRVLGY